MNATQLKPAAVADLDAVLALNNAAVPDVNRLERSDLSNFLENAPYFKVARTGTTLMGFLIALTPNVSYSSPNFRWFKARYRRFYYIDRIVIAPEARGSGLGRRFYRDLEGVAAGVAPRLACEVNLRPANSGSLRFHHRFGFVDVGRQDTENGTKTVTLMIKDLER